MSIHVFNIHPKTEFTVILQPVMMAMFYNIHIHSFTGAYSPEWTSGLTFGVS